MKNHQIILITGVLATMLITAFAFTTKKETTLKKPVIHTTKGFALVELYTSEGCSSCPSADKLAARVQKQYQDQEVYFIAYHVDYWNNLGWKDVFSSPDYSKRQRAYASYLNISSVYTPQMVVNGKTEFVGSDESSLQNAIQKSLQKAAQTQLSLSNLSLTPGKASIQYQTSGAPHNSDLLIAFVQKAAQTQVKAGENGGHMLAHINIVRKLQTIVLGSQPNGTASLTLPDGFNSQGWDIVGFIQNTTNGEISAAQKASLINI